MEHPQPDDKNWTWVLARRCPDSSFDARTIARHAIGATLRTTVGAWHAVLSRGELVHQRPPSGGRGVTSRCRPRIRVPRARCVRPVQGKPSSDAYAAGSDVLELGSRRHRHRQAVWEDDPVTVREALREAGDRLADAFGPGARPPVDTDRHALRRGTFYRRIVWSVFFARSSYTTCGM